MDELESFIELLADLVKEEIRKEEEGKCRAHI